MGAMVIVMLLAVLIVPPLILVRNGRRGRRE
jgi:hypothetical protein